MKLYLIVFCLVSAVRSATANDNYYCYHWTDGDLKEISAGKSEASVCESYLGYIYTQGQNADYPNCGTCYCCKPEGYKCYHWTDEDYAALHKGITVEDERQQCESYDYFTFQGDSGTYPYCGGCWCCQPVYECYHWKDEDWAVLGESPTAEQERSRCEDLGFIFTKGANDDFPGTGGCWCIRPKADDTLDLSNDNYYCYHWTDGDLEEISAGKSEASVCESYLGYIYTQGQNADYPNCGTCYCCKPEGYKCYHWTDEDYAALDNTPTIEDERQQCESYDYFTFQGDSGTYPYCGGCWCCQPVYECYHWKDEDWAVLGESPTAEQERSRCEDLGFIFTKGANDDFPGTGGCWCIRPKADDTLDLCKE